MLTRGWKPPSPRTISACVAAYVLAAVAFTWPLARYLSTRFTGLPGSDLGVYVWNLWVFRHEAMAGRSPLSTSAIFSLDGRADLSLHNYTIFSNILAFPLLPVAGIVASHNLLVLFNLVAAATTMFLLAFYVTRRPAAAWLAGLLFGFSPMLVARSEIDPSLAAAAPLPLFVFILFRLDATRSWRWAVAGGTTFAWAAICDPYYAVYCLVLGAWYLWARVVRIRYAPWAWRASTRALQVLDGAIAALLLLVTFILVTGGVQFAVGRVRIGLSTVYTPNLLLTLAVAARVVMTIRPRFRIRAAARWVELARLLCGVAGVGAVLLGPIVYALAARWADGRYVSPRVFWRTSTPGADLMTLFLPNPNHPWFGAPWRHWLTAEPGGFAENVTSITLVAVVTIVAARWLARWRVPRFWAGLALIAGSLTLGPFVRVATLNTYVPTPWALLRYVPVIGAARAPSRMAVLLILAVSVLFALAVKALADRRPAVWRLPTIALAGVLLVVELCPAPRVLHDATIPSIYATIANDPRDVRVLELPFGVRDGLSSFGSFSAASQFYQTLHGKRLIGGYLSRVSSRRVDTIRRRPVLALLMALSEGRTASETDTAAAARRGPAFVEAARIGYVVVDRSRATPELVDVATGVLRLEKIGESRDRVLYRPRASQPAALARGDVAAVGPPDERLP